MRPGFIASRFLPREWVHDRPPDNLSPASGRHQRRTASQTADFRGDPDEPYTQHRHAGPLYPIRRSVVSEAILDDIRSKRAALLSI